MPRPANPLALHVLEFSFSLIHALVVGLLMREIGHSAVKGK